MNALENLKALLLGTSKKPHTADSVREAVALLAGELESARQELDSLLAQRDDLTLQSLAKDDTKAMESLRERVMHAERRVAEITAAHSAAWVRLRGLEDTEAAAAIAARWKVARDLIDKRSAAGVRLQAALDAAAAAIREIVELDNQILMALPAHPRHFAPSLGGLGLQHLVELQLATHAAPLWGKARGLLSIDELQRGPGLAERIKADGALLLALAPATMPQSKPVTA